LFVVALVGENSCNNSNNNNFSAAAEQPAKCTQLTKLKLVLEKVSMEYIVKSIREDRDNR
jgi:hypothetical protein